MHKAEGTRGNSPGVPFFIGISQKLIWGDFDADETTAAMQLSGVHRAYAD